MCCRSTCHNLHCYKPGSWASTEIFAGGGTSTFRLSFFRLRMMQCKWTFTKRFILSSPQRKFPMKARAPLAFFWNVIQVELYSNLRKIVLFVILYSFCWIVVSSNIIIIVNSRQLSLNWTWTVHNCVCGAQWRTQKIFTGGVSFSGIPTFWRSLLTLYAYSSTRTLLILCVIALNINYQRYKLGYRRNIHSTLRHSSS